tara:strand:- start:436 stop:1017 length:582 start_codon:yes stop_codon:yes gene_type:complete
MALPAYIDAETGAITDGEAWVALATATPSGANVSFTSTNDGQVGDWSQYMDLVVIGYARSGVSGTGTAGVYLRLNNDTGSNYAWQQLQGDGSSASADYQSAISYVRFGVAPQVSATANQFGSYVMHFFDINSGKYKSATCQGACDMDGSGNVNLFGAVWKNQDPLIEIDLLDDTGFVSGSRFDLFGILPRMVA